MSEQDLSRVAVDVQEIRVDEITDDELDFVMGGLFRVWLPAAPEVPEGDRRLS